MLKVLEEIQVDWHKYYMVEGTHLPSIGKVRAILANVKGDEA